MSTTLQYTSHPKDIQAFKRYWLNHRFHYRIIVKIILGLAALALVALIILVMIVAYRSPSGLIILWNTSKPIVLGFTPAYITLIIVLMMVKILSWTIHKKDGVKNISLIIDDEGLSISNGKIESIIKWSSIENIEEGSQHYFLLVGYASGHVIPHRAFETTAQRKSFMDAMITHCRNLNPKVVIRLAS
ncbi:MAG: YcxB family protein [Bdellovibrionales bacterium]|nr:YcxB family protein [Bdellovibrionales bacterium]